MMYLFIRKASIFRFYGPKYVRENNFYPGKAYCIRCGTQRPDQKAKLILRILLFAEKKLNVLLFADKWSNVLLFADTICKG